MNNDAKKIIEICRKPIFQAAVREIYPEQYKGYAVEEQELYPGEQPFFIDYGKASDGEGLILIPCGVTADLVPQVDVMLMAVLEIGKFACGELWKTLSELLEDRKLDCCERDNWSFLNHSDLCLKIIWLAEILEEKRKKEEVADGN